MYSAKLRCKTSEFGYSVGDEVDITGATDGDGARTIVTWASATVVGYNCSGVAPLIRRRDGTNAGLIITSSNWRLVFRAWR